MVGYRSKIFNTPLDYEWIADIDNIYLPCMRLLSSSEERNTKTSSYKVSQLSYLFRTTTPSYVSTNFKNLICETKCVEMCRT